MSETIPTWKIARPEHHVELLALLRDFYAEEQLEFNPARIGTALETLLDDPGLGIVLILTQAGRIGGYLIATAGFSVEFGGYFVLVDELYLAPDFRGRGEWKNAIAATEEWAAGIGASAVRLEVNHHNEKAAAIYLKYGFKDDHRAILSKRVNPM